MGDEAVDRAKMGDQQMPTEVNDYGSADDHVIEGLGG